MFGRDDQVVQLIREEGFARIPVLAARLDVSQSTVRRILSRLEQQGEVSRAVGGAVLSGGRHNGGTVAAFDERKRVALREKIAIAREAARFVSEGDTIFLGGGSTVGQMPRFLLGKTLQVVTNSLAIAAQFEDSPTAEVLVTGGYLFPRHRLLSGPLTVAALRDLHFTWAFIGAGAFSTRVVTDWNVMMAEVNRTALHRAEKGVALVDVTKFDRHHLARVCDVSELTALVTARLPPAARLEIETAGTRLLETEVAPEAAEAPGGRESCGGGCRAGAPA